MPNELRSLWGIYHNELPPLIEQLAATPAMLRLQQVGMNCGCEYTHFRRFLRLRPYSRYDHSVGVALIVWHFTQDARQAAAGLLHDIATPTFAHVVDFLRGDYLTQEATEDGTRQIIDESAEIQRILRQFGLTTEDVFDYHRYPIADNDSPRLSSDRLEYTLGNLINFGLTDAAEVRRLYGAIAVAENEQGERELAFTDAALALRFSEFALACSQVYVSDEDRYAMQMLAELLRDAIAADVLCERDLAGTEPELIEKLCTVPAWKLRWERYCAMSAMERTETPGGDGWRSIDAKRRCIDPLVVGQSRVSALFPDFGEQLRCFAAQSFAYWVRSAP